MNKYTYLLIVMFIAFLLALTGCSSTQYDKGEMVMVLSTPKDCLPWGTVLSYNDFEYATLVQCKDSNHIFIINKERIFK